MKYDVNVNINERLQYASLIYPDEDKYLFAFHAGTIFKNVNKKLENKMLLLVTSLNILNEV